MKPVGSRLIVTFKHVTEKTTKSGIILQESHPVGDPRMKEGDVVEVGPGRLLDNGTRLPMDVKVGDKVLFSFYNSIELNTSDTETKNVLINDTDVFCIL